MSLTKVPIGAAGWILAAVVAALLAGCGSDDLARDDAGRIAEAGPLAIGELRKGDCLGGLPRDTALEVDAVPCKAAHVGEVYTVIELDDGDWPGDKVVTGKGERGCPARLRREYPTAAADSGVKIFYYTPTAESWDGGDRALPCVAGFDKPRSGALKAKKVS